MNRRNAGLTPFLIEFVAHEITHSEQSYRLGGRANFLTLYVLVGIAEAMIVPAGDAPRAAYQNNDFEGLAKRKAKNIIKDLKKKGVEPCPIEMGNIGTASSE